MNDFLKLSIEYANTRSYLDDLFQVYPTIPDGIRKIDESVWSNIEKYHNSKDNEMLINSLLELNLFPIKDSYVAYLRKDKTAKDRNPNTINRLAGRLYEMGLDKVYEKCSEPKETNRQMGQSFSSWLNKKNIGILPVRIDDFLSNNENAILGESDEVITNFAREHLKYKRRGGKKRLDFVGRFNGKYIIGEAKFLTDFGGHQNAQFLDAIETLESDVKDGVIKIAILDGVLYIKTNNKIHNAINNQYSDYNIMSALVLRNFLYQV